MSDVGESYAIVPHLLGELVDVVQTSPVDGDVLVWDAGLNRWKPGAGAGGGGGGGTVLPAATDGQMLAWNASSGLWEAVDPPAVGIGLPENPTDGQTIAWNDTLGVWQAVEGSGRELDYAEDATLVNGPPAGAEGVDVPNLVLEFTVGPRPVYVEFSGNGRSSTAGAPAAIQLTNMANVLITDLVVFDTAGASDFTALYGRHRFPAGTGLVQCKARLWNLHATATVSLYGTSQKSILTAVER